MPSAVPNGMCVRSSADITMPRIRAHGRSLRRPMPTTSPGTPSARKKNAATMPPRRMNGMASWASAGSAAVPTMLVTAPVAIRMMRARAMISDENTTCRMARTLTWVSTSGHREMLGEPAAHEGDDEGIALREHEMVDVGHEVEVRGMAGAGEEIDRLLRGRPGVARRVQQQQRPRRDLTDHVAGREGVHALDDLE